MHTMIRVMWLLLVICIAVVQGEDYEQAGSPCGPLVRPVGKDKQVPAHYDLDRMTITKENGTFVYKCDNVFGYYLGSGAFQEKPWYMECANGKWSILIKQAKRSVVTTYRTGTTVGCYKFNCDLAGGVSNCYTGGDPALKSEEIAKDVPIVGQDKPPCPTGLVSKDPLKFYTISVVKSDGTFETLDNEATHRIVWDGDAKLWHFTFADKSKPGVHFVGAKCALPDKPSIPGAQCKSPIVPMYGYTAADAPKIDADQTCKSNIWFKERYSLDTTYQWLYSAEGRRFVCRAGKYFIVNTGNQNTYIVNQASCDNCDPSTGVSACYRGGDPALKNEEIVNATITPVVAEDKPPCPTGLTSTNPPRFYTISIFKPDGTFETLDNEATHRIVWDKDAKLWHFTFADKSKPGVHFLGAKCALPDVPKPNGGQCSSLPPMDGHSDSDAPKFDVLQPCKSYIWFAERYSADTYNNQGMDADIRKVVCRARKYFIVNTQNQNVYIVAKASCGEKTDGYENNMDQSKCASAVNEAGQKVYIPIDSNNLGSIDFTDQPYLDAYNDKIAYIDVRAGCTARTYWAALSDTTKEQRVLLDGAKGGRHNTTGSGVSGVRCSCSDPVAAGYEKDLDNSKCASAVNEAGQKVYVSIDANKQGSIDFTDKQYLDAYNDKIAYIDIRAGCTARTYWAALSDTTSEQRILLDDAREGRYNTKGSGVSGIRCSCTDSAGSSETTTTTTAKPTSAGFSCAASWHTQPAPLGNHGADHDRDPYAADLSLVSGADCVLKCDDGFELQISSAKYDGFSGNVRIWMNTVNYIGHVNGVWKGKNAANGDILDYQDLWAHCHKS